CWKRSSARWDGCSRQERRSLFEAFATHIHLSKITRHTKTVTVHWRDGSTVSANATHKSTGYFWEEEALEQLRAMVESDVDQWEILKTFPDYTWKALQERYAYQFGQGHWRTAYARHKPYGRYTRWRSTEECRAEQKNPPLSAPQRMASSGSTDPPRPIFCGEYGRSSLLQSENPAAMDGASGGRPHPPQ
ncbi:MAG: hypothetical protein HC828_06115, partial [Blastochloris sp.]|nr:hypothetical protein [Blastochloris sp.]